MTTILLLLLSFFFNLPACATEDSTHCYWDASVQGQWAGCFVHLAQRGCSPLPALTEPQSTQTNALTGLLEGGKVGGVGITPTTTEGVPMPLLSAFRQATQDVHQRASDKRLDKALKGNPSAVTLLTKVHTMREVQSLLPYGWKLVAQDTLHHTFLGSGVARSTFVLAHDNPTLEVRP